MTVRHAVADRRINGASLIVDMSVRRRRPPAVLVTCRAVEVLAQRMRGARVVPFSAAKPRACILQTSSIPNSAISQSPSPLTLLRAIFFWSLSSARATARRSPSLAYSHRSYVCPLRALPRDAFFSSSSSGLASPIWNCDDDSHRLSCERENVCRHVSAMKKCHTRRRADHVMDQGCGSFSLQVLGEEGAPLFLEGTVQPLPPAAHGSHLASATRCSVNVPFPSFSNPRSLASRC
ncbi:hypothetical protein CC86DRAFT_29914 [Ophiobolus disseminans]|uniref:Uncharacterized protein n=1 Tax=Ophiobolus disseminans TaxID=1469910 RepID=A0A6A7A1M0_9PLEO|nr:hypothetical protein CC86DRAFT_29914 [Ophiobolus disseminans]